MRLRVVVKMTIIILSIRCQLNELDNCARDVTGQDFIDPKRSVNLQIYPGQLAG